MFHMYVVIKPSVHYTLQIIQIYTPTSRAKDEELAQLYEDIVKVKKSRKLPLHNYQSINLALRLKAVATCVMRKR